MPVQELQEKTTSTEFLEWVEFLKQDMNAFHREDYYLAQIAAEIRKGNLKAADARRLEVKDFIIKFSFSEDRKAPKKYDMNASKRFWRALSGVKAPG